MSRDRSSRRVFNIVLSASGFICAFSGLLIQVKYHMGHGGEHRWFGEVCGLGYRTWSTVHKLSSIAFLAAAVLHLVRNGRWIRRMIDNGRIYQHKQLLLFGTFFGAAVLTGLAAWTASFFSQSRYLPKFIIEIHDKLTVGLFVLLILHAYKRRRRIVKLD